MLSPRPCRTTMRQGDCLSCDRTRSVSSMAGLERKQRGLGSAQIAKLVLSRRRPPTPAGCRWVAFGGRTRPGHREDFRRGAEPGSHALPLRSAFVSTDYLRAFFPQGLCARFFGRKFLGGGGG